ncbi:MAG: CBS domain-containing protein, partial [Verrucomicrobia bacterium]|nr:CBS domain-containing protein [Verrucomicrobiota bacterium]
RILALNHRTAGDAMRPRAQMVVLPDDLPVDDLVRAARESRHHRIPLYDETPDNIVAVLNTRTLLLAPVPDLDEALEFPSFVPESMNLMALFQSLQRQQRGLAIVLDEFGSAAGLVTVEDILETVVGEIRGEGEPEGFLMERMAPGRWRVSGALRLDDFAREFAGLGDDPDVDTLGGLVVKLAEVVPAPGEVFQYRGVRFTVRAADERRVRELLVDTSGGTA